MKKNTHSSRRRIEKRYITILKITTGLLVLCVLGVAVRAVYIGAVSADKSRTKEMGISTSGISEDTYIAAQSSNIQLSVTSTAAVLITTVTAVSTPSPSPTAAPVTVSQIESASPESTAAKETAAETAAGAADDTKPAHTASADGSAPDLTGYVVVLDPGHQLHANSDQESLGPDLSETKDKCSSGTSGVSTGRPEYEVNLEIALRMQDYLQSLGCEVYLTRSVNDIDISNIDRANIALSYSPDVYIRLHCDGSTNSSSRGVGVFVADSGKYAGSLSDWGDMLGRCYSDATGAKYRGCNAGSTYSGLNWAADIPSFLLEMGFMSNSTDDELLSDPDYQQNICSGVADFVSQMPHIS